MHTINGNTYAQGTSAIATLPAGPDCQSVASPIANRQAFDLPVAAPQPGDPLTSHGSSVPALEFVRFPALNQGPSPRTSNELRTSPRRSRRHGAIARLPKDCRDLVNRMLTNGVVYKRIVAALQECGHTVSERNISNWYVSGYKDWQDDQAEALHHARIQDAILDHFRQTDSSQLAEVGLQTVATRLSELLLEKTIVGDDIQSALPQYRQLVDLLCRVNREIISCHKNRDQSAKHKAWQRNRDLVQLKEIERIYSQGAVAPDPDTQIPASAPESLPPAPTNDRSAGCQPAVSPVGNRRASEQPKSADPLPDPAKPIVPEPIPASASEISNVTPEPAPTLPAALNAQPSTNDPISDPSGTVQKLSPPADAASSVQTSTFDVQTTPAPEPVTAPYPPIWNNKSESGPEATSNPIPESAAALNSEPSTFNGFSATSGTVQKLSPPAEPSTQSNQPFEPSRLGCLA